MLGDSMSIGTLVKLEKHLNYKGIGIVIDDMKQQPKSSGKYRMVSVRWLDGMGVGLYWTDELEVVCE